MSGLYCVLLPEVIGSLSFLTDKRAILIQKHLPEAWDGPVFFNFVGYSIYKYLWAGMDLLQFACYTKEQQQRIQRGALVKQEFASEKKRIFFFFSAEGEA